MTSTSRRLKNALGASEESGLETAAWEGAPGAGPAKAADERAGPPTISPLGERYQDLGRIGRGGMGEVRRVQDHAMGRVLAMKLLPSERLDSPRDRARFLAEARTTAALQHPGIIPVHDAGELADGRLWFTMKEVRGRTLRVVIAELHRARDNPATYGPSLRRVLDAFLRVCEAVAYAHSRGVVHRDLKPDNIMIGEFGEVLVMDWGLARSSGAGPDSGQRPAGSGPPDAEVDSERTLLVRGPSSPKTADPLLTEPGEIMGTLAYMPPEQARAESSRMGPPTDVYALGGVLYEILTGRPPYTGTASSVWKQLLRGPPPSVEKTAGAAAPADLCAICARAMARRPEDRFPDAGALAAELLASLDGARRRDRALAIVADARAMKPRIEALRVRARALRAQARAILGGLRSYDPAEQKAEGWRIEDEAERLDREVSIEEVNWTQTLRSALHEVPDLAEAHDDLAQHYLSLLVAAEEARDARGAGRYEALLRLHDRGRFAAVLAGDGALTLVTDPEGAEVSLYRYIEQDRRLMPEYVKELGRTPIRAETLQRGSYLLKIRAPGCEETFYPVHIARGEHWDGVRPGDKEPHPVWLPRIGELSPGGIYVPAGWFLSGGDPLAVESLPRRRLWVDGLVVQRFPVTNAEYLEFLNALVMAGREADALTACPRVPLGRSGPGEAALAYARDAEGRFCLAEADASARDALRWPVVYVDWQAAMRYARWLAETTAQPWRLLNELEWEKAARGVDGRLTPWGDHVEATWACIIGSHSGVPSRAPVDDYPTDVSPYGVRGMAGNVRDRCINVWKLDGPAVVDGVVQLDAAGDDDPDLRVTRGGAWTNAAHQCHVASRFAGAPSVRYGGTGLRVARPLSG